MNTILRDLKLDLDEDSVLRGQGAVPEVIRARRPALVETARQALEMGRPLLRPAVVYRQLAVKALRHECIDLEGGHTLRSPLAARQLRASQVVVAAVCTVGVEIEALSSQLYEDQPSLSLAVDGLGTAAVDALAVAACRHFGAQAARRSWNTTMPISPGMVDWPLDTGQPQLFALLEPDPAIVTLLASGQMTPRKSTSLVIGMGSDVTPEGETCDFCAMKETCRYRTRRTKSPHAHPGLA